MALVAGILRGRPRLTFPKRAGDFSKAGVVDLRLSRRS